VAGGHPIHSVDFPIGDDDRIPAIDWHRGCAIEDPQPHDRVKLVKRAIDHIHGLSLDDAEALVAYAGDARNPPEARLYAAARLEALWQLASEERRLRPGVSLERLRASVAGLGSKTWRSPWHFASLLDAGGTEREQPLADEE
jgi:hypothetical protein